MLAARSNRAGVADAVDCRALGELARLLTALFGNATVAVRASDVAFGDFGLDQPPRVSPADHLRHITDFDVTHVVEVENGAIRFAAINARMIR
ncbi:MAG TPA: hypothetical protein VGK15_05090 [Candidatus Limnocylindria bacterium]